MRRVRESQLGIQVEEGEGKENGIGVNNKTQKDKGFRDGDCRTSDRGSGQIFLLRATCGLGVDRVLFNVTKQTPSTNPSLGVNS